MPHVAADTTQILALATWRLSEDASVLREPPRPPEAREPGFEDRFDFRTVFYDVFELDGEIVLLGPPLLNLRDGLESARWRLDGVPVRVDLGVDRLGKISFSRIAEDQVPRRAWLRRSRPRRLEIESVLGSATVEVSPSAADLFAGRRVLSTMQKENSLGWMRDWVSFHVQEHGVDAVLIYDNGSASYTPSEVLDVVASVPGVASAVVVPWRFPYGPVTSGDPAAHDYEERTRGHDSAFCQLGGLNHARLRVLARAEGVINADIDELVIAGDRRSVFAHAHESASGVARYRGRWIEGVADDPRPAGGTTDDDAPVRHRDFVRFDPDATPALPKWTVVDKGEGLGSFWRPHVIAGRSEFTEAVSYRHFRAISTHWKYARDLAPQHELEVDGALREVLDERFPPAGD